MSNQSIPAYYLPLRTAEVIQQHINRCQNLALVLDKYVKREVIEDTKQKGLWLRERIQAHAIDVKLAQSIYHRWLSMLKALDATHFDATLDWRMVVGLGGDTVLETDITLHYLYGIPLIPGSALKGLTRAYVTGEETAYFVPIDAPETERKPSREEKTDHSDIQRIFGTQKKAGTVLFFDALPLNGKATFVVDIMNPHYPDYYKTLKNTTITPPANNQSPNPITFLTVTNTTFTFALAPRHPNKPEYRADAELAKAWLLKALQKYGVGGKTSAGYGYFQEDSQSVQTQQPSMQSETLHRPNLPKFHEGQELFHNSCTVIVPTDSMRQLYRTASAYLRYQEFSTRNIFIVIEADLDEARSWKPKETKGCIITHIEEHTDTVVLICKPKPKKNKPAHK